MKQNQKGIIAFQGQLVMWDDKMMTALNDVKWLIENKSQVAWLQSFAPEVNRIQNEVKILQDEYCVIENGQLKFEEPKPQMQLVGVDTREQPQQPKMLMQSGKSEEEYNQKFNAIWLKKILLPL